MLLLSLYELPFSVDTPSLLSSPLQEALASFSVSALLVVVVAADWE